ncbi:MAG: hypothetical protein WD873_03700 [Candidatus Hydrogenedentales bacterium]
MLEDVHEATLMGVAKRLTTPELPSTLDELYLRMEGRYIRLRPVYTNEDTPGIFGRSIELRSWSHIWVEYNAETGAITALALVEKGSEEVDMANPVPDRVHDRLTRWTWSVGFIVLLLGSAFIVWYTEDRNKPDDSVLRILAAVALTLLLPFGYCGVLCFYLQLTLSL